MGQYHMIACADTREFLLPHTLGCGLKMLEQGLTYGGTRAGLIALISRLPGNQPADLAHSTLVGRWAGKRCLGIGDYAHDDDIPGWTGEPLSELYGLCDGQPELKDYMRWRQAGRSDEEHAAAAQKSFEKALAEWQKRDKESPHYKDLSEEMLGLIESACGVRYADNDGWRAFVTVKPLAELGPDGKARYVLTNRSMKPVMSADMIVSSTGVESNARIGGEEEKIDQGYLDYLFRMTGTRDHWWERAPRDGAHHNFRDKDIDLGQRRVIASLDTRQYFDPTALGEVPTTAALMRGDGDNSSATALMLMLMHEEARGGGDCDRDLFPSQGIWHGHRVIATAEREDGSGQFPTTEEVKDSFTDISEQIVKQLAAANEQGW